jgi:recombination associated protein RdgC
MGAFRGSITFSKFYVRGELPEDFRDRFMESIHVRAFRPLDPSEEIDFRVGWCSITDPFDLELTHEKVFFNQYLNIGFRVDRWRIPGPLFKATFRQAERDYLDKHGVEKLSRAQKKNLEQLVNAQLRRKVVPSMRAIDLSWNLNEGVVRFFQKSAKQAELMNELFEKTFELELVPDGAYVAAERRGLPEALVESLPQLDETLFHAEK